MIGPLRRTPPTRLPSVTPVATKKVLSPLHQVVGLVDVVELEPGVDAALPLLVVCGREHGSG